MPVNLGNLAPAVEPFGCESKRTMASRENPQRSEAMVSVVVPSYNRKESVLRLLADISRQVGVEFEIIVVDDCSSDGSPDAIARAFPQVTLLRSDSNGGPCVARNRGIRASRGEFIVGLDSDVSVPDPTLLSRVFEAFKSAPTNVAVLAFRLLQPDGVSEDKARWWHPLPIARYADRTFESSYFSGTGYAFRKEGVIAAGLFPEILYMHYEEVELAWRILDNGSSIIHCPDLSVLHHEHQISRRSEIKTFYKVRNQILLAAGCLSPLRGVIFLAPRISLAAFHAIVRGHLPSFLRALRSAVSLLPRRARDRRPLSNKTWKRMAALRLETSLPALF